MDAKKYVKKIETARAKDRPSDKQISAVKKALKGLTKLKKQLRADLKKAHREKDKKRLKSALKINKLHRKKAVKFLKALKD